jgi:hypothetical protein
MYPTSCAYYRKMGHWIWDKEWSLSHLLYPESKKKFSILLKVLLFTRVLFLFLLCPQLEM